MSELSSQPSNDDGLHEYPRSYQQDCSVPTPMPSLLPPTNPSVITEMSPSRVEQKIQNPPRGSKRKRSAAWPDAGVRPGEGRLALDLLIKYRPNPTIEEMKSISHDTGYPLEFVIHSYCENKSSGKANDVLLYNNATVDHRVQDPDYLKNKTRVAQETQLTAHRWKGNPLPNLLSNGQESKRIPIYPRLRHLWTIVARKISSVICAEAVLIASQT